MTIICFLTIYGGFFLVQFASAASESGVLASQAAHTKTGGILQRALKGLTTDEPQIAADQAARSCAVEALLSLCNK